MKRLFVALALLTVVTTPSNGATRWTPAVVGLVPGDQLRHEIGRETLAQHEFQVGVLLPHSFIDY